jgi:uncharacterized protein YbjQ (UPF0145 family)
MAQTIKMLAYKNDINSDQLTDLYFELFPDVAQREKDGSINVDESLIDELLAKAALAFVPESEIVIMMTSGYNFEGYKIVEYVDFISAESVEGMGVFTGFAASVSNLTGDSSDSLESKLDSVRDSSIYKLKKQAVAKYCNAIIGLDLDFTMFGETMVGVIANGTAVKVEALDGTVPAGD